LTTVDEQYCYCLTFLLGSRSKTLSPVSDQLSDPCPLVPLLQYLLRVLTAWVQAIDESPASSEPGCPAAPPPPALPLPASGPRADWWPSVCLELGVLLQVNPDILRRHLVCELYSQGLDPRAEEVRGSGDGSELDGTFCLIFTTFTFTITFKFTFTFRAFGRRFYPKRVHLLKERQQYITVVPEDKNRAVFEHSYLI